MPLYIRVAGAWKEFDPSVKVSGAWKAITDGYVNVSGVWKRIYGGGGGEPPPDPRVVNAVPESISVAAYPATIGAVTLSTTGPTTTGTTSGFGTPATQTITYTSVGDITGSANGGQNLGDWFSPPDGANGSFYWARVTYVSGDIVYLSGAGLEWIQMSSNRAWTFQNSEEGPSVLAGVYRFQIADDSGGTSIVGDRNCTITLEVESP